jgi:hypothetical protein
LRRTPGLECSLDFAPTEANGSTFAAVKAKAREIACLEPIEHSVGRQTEQLADLAGS